MTTKEKLAVALNESGAPTAMVELAMAGAYDDFESNSATPINDLIRDSRLAGLDDITQRAMNGDFDGTKEESQAWFEREGKQLLGGL